MIFVPIVFVLFICGMICVAMADNQKPGTAFLLGFLFGPIGILVVLAASLFNQPSEESVKKNAQAEAMVRKKKGLD